MPTMRIATLTCSNTEILAALGFADHLCAVDNHSDFPEEALQGLPRLGPDLSINMALLQELKPDLVLASHSVPGMEKVTAQLAETGLRYEILDPTSWSGVLESIRTVGRVLSCIDRAETLIQDMQNEIQSLRESLPAFEAPPKVMVEWWPRPVIVATQDSWITDMLRLLGAENAFSHLEKRSSPVTDQQVIEAAPELIVCSWCGVKKLRPEVIENRKGWEQIPAIQNQKVVCIPESGLGRPGPRLMEGFRALAEVLREGFAQPEAPARPVQPH